MKKLALILLVVALSFTVQSKNYTKIFRNYVEGDTLKAGYALVINGDTLQSLNPTEGQILKFVGGKYTNTDPEALAADSMLFDKTSGILSIYKNGFATLHDTLDGRYALITAFNDSISAIRSQYMPMAQYDTANISEQVVGISATQTLSNKTLTTPVVSNFSLAQHDHSSAAQGGPVASNVFSINLPVASTVAGRCSGAVSGTDYPAGWALAAGTSSVDLVITHNLDRDIANVTVFSIDANGKRLLLSNAAYSGYVAPSKNALRIEALATVTKPILIQLIFGK